MGIDLQIRTLLRETWAPQAFSETHVSYKNAVVIDDVMTRVFTLYGPSPGGTFTGDQLFDAFFKPIREALYDRQADVYIAVCDDQEGVPIQKGATQSKRSKTSKVIPYPTDCELTADGLRINGAPAAPFETQKLFRTRSLRQKVWQFMLIRLKQQSFPAGKTFLFDFDTHTGPVLFQTIQKAREMPELKHSLGEADLAVPFYIDLFPDHKVMIHSCDSDTLPVVSCGMKRGRPPQSVIWVYEDRRIVAKKRKRDGEKKAMVYVDMVSLQQDLINEKFGLSPQQFALLTFIAGNDFVEKEWCFSYFGIRALVQAVQSFQQLQEALNEDKENPGLVMLALENTVRGLLGQKLNSNSDYVKASKCRESHPSFYELEENKQYLKRHSVPTEENMGKCVAALIFNYNYWVKQTPASAEQSLALKTALNLV